MLTAAFPQVAMTEPATATVAACYLAHRDRVYRWSLRYAGGRSDWAEDLAHDVFVRLTENFSKLDDTDEIGRWLYRVTANLAISRLRRERLALNRLVMLVRGERTEHEPPADRILEEREQAAQAMAALRQLPAKERVVICMRVLDGLSQKEIAEALELSEGYVSKLLKRAWARLQEAGWREEP
jgi:RNA polymerase sigma-70 factor, ECF subfamily